MITFYGAPMSNAGRSRWMLEECGVPYAYEIVDLRDDAQRAAFAEVFPGCKIPYLIDGDVRLSESMAINFYLAETYQPELVPADRAGRALAYQWSFWAITNLQPEALAVMRNTTILPPEQRSAAAADAGRTGSQRFVDQLEAALAGDWLIGDHFTIADLNAGSVVGTATRIGAAKAGPRVAAWLDHLRARTAYQKAFAPT